MTKFLSGRSKRRDQGSLTTDRYLYLGIDQTEPNLGDPNSGTFQDNPPSGERYQIISVEGFPGERYWIPVEGGVIPGSISVYDETTTLVGNANSITQLNFVGAAVNASTFNFKETTITLLGSGTPSGTHSFALGIAVTQKSGDGYAEGIVKFETNNVGFVTLTNVRGTFNTTVENELFEGTFPGVGIAKTPTTLVPVTTVGIAATIKVSPEEFSDNKQVIFNDNEEFGSGNLYFDKGNSRLGVGIANPTKALDVSGDIELTDDIYIPGIFYLGASANDSGSQGAIIKQGAGGTMEWVTLESILSGAGGTIGNVQFHGTTQLVDGDNLFNFNPYLERVGVNTTFPAQVFQVGVGYEYKEQKLVLNSNFPFGITAGMKFEQPGSSGAVAYATSYRGIEDNVTLVRFYPKIIEGRALENYPNFATGGASSNNITINGTPTNRTVSSTVVYTGFYNGSTSVTTIDADGRVGIGTLKTTSKQDGTIAKLQIDGDVLFTGDSYDALWDTSASALRLYDGTKLTVGNGYDLQIYHSSNNSYIDNYTNHLYIRNNVDNDDGGDIYIEAKKGESSIDCISDGGVILYNNHSQKFKTTADGITVYDGTSLYGNITGKHFEVRYGNGEPAYLKLSNQNVAPGITGIKDGFYLYSVYDDLYSNGYISLNSDSNSLPLTIGVVDYHQGLSATGIHTAIKVNQFNEVGVSTNGTSVELWFENGGTNNTLDRQGFHGSKKLETTEEGITVYNKTTTPELNATVKTETVDLKATGVSTFKNITLGFADDNTVGTTLGGLTIDSQGTVTVEDSVVINSTENTTGNADGALIIDGGVHIKKDMLLCNDLDTLDTIDPVKVGIGTLSPQSRFQIGTKSEYFTDLTATGNLSFTPGTPGVGTDGITGIDTTGIEVGQEVKSPYFYTGTKVNLIGGLVPPSGTGIGTIYVDTVSTNTSTLNSQSFGFGSRGGTREEKSIFTVTDQGKVGVGTLTPRFALDVVDTLGIGHTLGVAQTAYVNDLFASDDIVASDAVSGDRLFAVSGAYILDDSPLRFGDNVNGNTLIYWDDGSDYNIWSNWDYRPVPAFSNLYSKGWTFNTIMYLANFGFAAAYSNFIITNNGNVSIGNSTSPASADDLEANTNNTTVLNCGIVTANQYYGSLFWGSHKGDGSQLTGVIGIGTGVELKRDGETVGAASTIDIGYGLKLTYSAEGGSIAGVATLRIDPNADIDGDRSIFSSFAEYASHSETSNGSYNLVGIGSTYIEVGAIQADTPFSNDDFGTELACSADGKTIIVCASAHDADVDNVGAVYVFDREGNTYSQVGFFTGSYAESEDDFFGTSVACSADGKTIVVGARRDNFPGSGTRSGLVYIFDRVGNDFNEVGILTGSYADSGSDYFGYSVACSADGKTIVVGAEKDENTINLNTGLVYVFDRVGNDFNEVGILGASDQNSSDGFGISVGCSPDGKTIVAGAPGHDGSSNSESNRGAVYVFDRVGNDFNEVGILTSSNSSAQYYFGRRAKISADGKTIVSTSYAFTTLFGGDLKGHAIVFDRVGNDFNEVGILTAGTEYADDLDRFGSSLAISADGKTIVVGASRDEIDPSITSSGLLHVFNRQGNNFNRVGVITGSYAVDQEDFFGQSVACSADGKTIIAGAHYDDIGSPSNGGVVYVFDQTTVARDAITATDTGVLITGDLNVTGDITAFYTSDERLKDNITPIDDPLEKVISISGNTFDWNQNSNKSGHDVGVIAQEIKEILPEAVTERDNGYLAVDYYKVIPLLIEAIKEISEDKNIITSKNGVKYRLVVDDDGNISTEKV